MLVRSVNKLAKDSGVPENCPRRRAISDCLRMLPVVGGYNRQGQTFHFPGRHADRLSEGSRTLSPPFEHSRESQAQNYKELPASLVFPVIMAPDQRARRPLTKICVDSVVSQTIRPLQWRYPSRAPEQMATTSLCPVEFRPHGISFPGNQNPLANLNFNTFSGRGRYTV